MAALAQRLRDVLRSAMKSQGVDQSMLVHRWHRSPGYMYEKREVVRTAVWRLLHPDYPLSLPHFELALKLLDCDMQLTIVPGSFNYESQEQSKGRTKARTGEGSTRARGAS